MQTASSTSASPSQASHWLGSITPMCHCREIVCLQPGLVSFFFFFFSFETLQKKIGFFFMENCSSSFLLYPPYELVFRNHVQQWLCGLTSRLQLCDFLGPHPPNPSTMICSLICIQMCAGDHSHISNASAWIPSVENTFISPHVSISHRI